MNYQTSTSASTSNLMSPQAVKVLRNTYMLLGLTLAFSALAALVSMKLQLQFNFIVMLVGFYGLMFLTHKLANSAWGLVSVFALTGFMGLTLGPVLSKYLGAGMGNVVVSAFSSTAIIFFALSAYALISKKDFQFLGKFIFVGFLVLLTGVIANLFLGLAGLHLAISAGFVIFSAAIILYQTSEIVHGGETNYISATVTLFVSIYNMFLSLLALLGMSND